MSQRMITTCDKCGKDIEEKEDFVDAGVYGMQFHLTCLTPQHVQMLQLLSLDDVRYQFGTGDTEKLIYSQWGRSMINKAQEAEENGN